MLTGLMMVNYQILVLHVRMRMPLQVVRVLKVLVQVMREGMNMG
jgi:hypothetical protein